MGGRALHAMTPALPDLRRGLTTIVMCQRAGCRYVYVSVVRLASKCQAAADGSVFIGAVPSGFLDIADGMRQDGEPG